MSTTAAPAAKQSIVTTAKGDVKKFTDAVSRFIVAHPKTAAIAALVIGFVVGKLI